MNLSAISHKGAYPDIYLIDRKTLIFTLHTAVNDIKSCTLMYYSRTNCEKIFHAPMEYCFSDNYHSHYSVKIIFEDTARYQKYYFKITDQADCSYYFNAWGFCEDNPENGAFEFLYANLNNVLKIPEWSKGQIYYQIFPERFCDGNPKNNPKECSPWGTAPTRENYMGGDIKGILKHLDYLTDLGVDCIYLNPIFQGDFNHKYATTDYFKIDPQFGTEEEFLQLVDELHKREIRILLDGVFNHCGIHFYAFKDLLENQQDSIYTDWFYVRHYPVNVSETNAPYECVGEYGYMPKLNTACEEVQNFICNVMIYWLEKFHIDGWRLDVADEVDNAAWTKARTEIKHRFPNALLLGETWGDGLELVDGKQMDIIMNYVFRDALRDFIAKESIDASTFSHRLFQMLSHYPEEQSLCLFNPLDSHDTERFLYFCNENKEKLKLAVMIQMCFPGAPSIYYGDEIGITGENDPDCRKCMVWNKKEQDLELLEYYKRMIQIRKSEACLKTGKTIENFSKEKVFSFNRYCDTDEICIVCNSDSQDKIVQIPVMHLGEYENLMNGSIYKAVEIPSSENKVQNHSKFKGILNVDLKSYEGKILKRRITL